MTMAHTVTSGVMCQCRNGQRGLYRSHTHHTNSGCVSRASRHEHVDESVGLRKWGGSGGELSVTSAESSLPLFKAECNSSYSKKNDFLKNDFTWRYLVAVALVGRILPGYSLYGRARGRILPNQLSSRILRNFEHAGRIIS
jgi:hypothetical protein